MDGLRFGTRSTLNQTAARCTNTSQPTRSDANGANRAKARHAYSVVQKKLKSSFASAAQRLHMRGGHASSSSDVVQGRPSFKVFSTFKPGQEEIEARQLESIRNNAPEADEYYERPRIEHGRLHMSSVAGRYIEERLNRESAGFNNAQEDQGGLQFRDNRGQVFHIQQTRNMAGALRASRLQGATHGITPSAPGREHLGVMSGVHVSRDQKQYRLGGTRVYRYDDSSNRSGHWQPVSDDTRYRRLARHADGRVYGTPHEGLDVSVSAGGYRFDLPRRDNSSVRISELPKAASDFAEGRDIGVSLRLKQGDGKAFNAVRIAHASEERLYATDEEGQLFISEPLPVKDMSLSSRETAQNEQTYFYHDGGSEGSIRMVSDRGGQLFNEREKNQPVKMSRVDTTPLERLLGGRIQVEDFMHDDNNQLNLLVRDRHDQLHSVLADEKEHFRPGWNLTDAIVMTDTRGLSSSVEYAQTIDLGRRGNLALDNETLIVQGADDARWNATRIDNVKKLDHGLNNTAYILRHGKVRKLDVEHTESRMPVDDIHELSPNQRRTRVVMGKTIAGSKHSDIQSFAIDDEKSFLTLNTKGKLLSHVEGRHVDLPLPPGIDAVQDIALDGEHALHALDKNGGLHVLEHRQWRRLHPDVAQWKRTPGPAGHSVDGLAISAVRRLIAKAGDQRFRLESSSGNTPQWQPISGALRQEPLYGGASSRLHDRLQADYEPTRGMRHGNANTTESHNLLGSAGNGPNALKQRHFLSDTRSHVKSIGGDSKHAVQMAWQRLKSNGVKGREALQTLYREERDMVQRLPALAAGIPPGSVENLEARVEALIAAGNDRHQPLLESLKKQAEKLEVQNREAMIHLGAIHNVMAGPVKESMTQRAERRLQVALGKERPANMMEDILRLLESFPATTNDSAAQTLKGLLQNGLYIERPSANARRDRSDPSAILRASLIQNAETIKALHGIIDDLQKKPDTIGNLEQTFDQKIYDTLEASELHQYASAAFNDYRSLENVDVAYQALQRDMGVEGRSLNAHLKHQLEHGDDLSEALTVHARSMQEGDATKVSTGKEFSVNTPNIFFAPPAPVYTAASAGISRSSEMAITRRNEGVNMTLSQKRGINANNTWGAFLVSTGGVADNPLGSALDENKRAKLGIFSGVDLVGSVGRDSKTALSMNLHGNDIQRVMSHFTQGNSRLLDLIKIGRDRTVSNAVTWTAGLDLSVTPVDFRIDAAGDLSSAAAWFRSAIGISADAGLVNYQNDSKRAYGPEGKSEQAKSQKADFFSKAGTNLLFRPVQGVISTDNTFQRSPLEISSTVKLDRSKNNTFSVAFKAPSKVTGETCDKLIRELKKEFPSQRQGIDDALQGLAQSVPERLKALSQWTSGESFAQGLNDEQNAVLMSLASLTRQQKAFDAKTRQFASATKKVSLPSAKGWLAPPQQNGPAATVSSGRLTAGVTRAIQQKREDAQHPWLKAGSKENQKLIREFIAGQPRFEELVRALEKRNTSAEAEFELKPSVRETIEDRVLNDNTKDLDALLREALQHPDNLRIRSVNVSHTVAAPSSFAPPPLLIGGRSVAMLEHTRQGGSIEFEYGVNADKPIAVRPGGGFALEDSASAIHGRLLRQNVGFHYLSNMTPGVDDNVSGPTQSDGGARGPSYQPVAAPNHGPL